MSILEGGEKRLEDFRNIAFATPPDDLQSRHLWSDNFPSWESPEAVDVTKSPYNAKGDGYTDDTEAIQKAIEQNSIIFLPKGYYNISAPLTLKPKTKLIGLARHLSIITSRAGVRSKGGSINLDAPLIKSAQSADSDTLIANLGLHTPYHIPDTYGLDWQSYGIIRDVNFDTLPPLGGFGKANDGMKHRRTHPLLLISGNGSGKIYNFFQDDGYPLAFGKSYSHLAVQDTKGPIAFYQCNLERSQGESNIIIDRSQHVSFFGLKGEGNKPVMVVRNSSDINVFGYGGNGAASEGNYLFIVKDSPDSTFVNLVDSPRLSGEGSAKHQEGYGVDPNKWQMIQIKDGDALFSSPYLERPLIIKTSAQVKQSQ
nr:hypothetical protein [Desulfobulbaceae bacterium]